MQIKWNEVTDVVIEGIDGADYPDFCDAYVSEAFWVATGEELTCHELEVLTEQNGCEVNQEAHESWH